ncbi:Cell growth-regulating nucleolar protein-like [Oopsacas minuta]|uniref:Cell growth-regulating nucleolar protein-like n=1 Tax=Oopsacas minuta TaxID=111878 RepID=A0AAV7K9G7_9METZ|nr:Cell growth-regulating nucleolar protein-like [Oopsacas minuta]
MVVFACNNCGDSLKKNQVERHALQSRGCNSFSCMDCCKDFNLQSYKAHTSCVSEAQRYQGALYEGPEDGESKGAKKQKIWFEQVKQSIESSQHLSPRVSSLLSAIADYPNVPRKQKKFENFVGNSLRERNPKIIQQVWEAFSGQSKTDTLEKDSITKFPEQNESIIERQELLHKEDDTIISAEEDVKIKKKKKKRRRDETETETKQLYEDNSENLIQESTLPDSTTIDEEPRIKSKKSKRSRNEIETPNEIEILGEKRIKFEDSEVKLKKKKRKHKHLKQDLEII